MYVIKFLTELVRMNDDANLMIPTLDVEALTPYLDPT